MTRPLIATKLYVPKLRRGVVARPRLLELLGSAGEARLTLVSAPAGFGKTTLLAAWMHGVSAGGGCVAWLSLDPADNELAGFWTYVISAIQGAVPGIGDTALESMASSSVPMERVLTTLLNELAAAPGEVWLVLDDYHLVDDHEVTEGMTFLLDHLPASMHVVVSTRADPDLSLARRRARGELVEIRAADLRFTFEEAHDYLNVATGLDLGAEDVDVLEERTEGWIAALQLAALSLRGREDVSGFLSRFAGDDRYIVDYLIEEVLRHQREDVRAFLMQSAVLDRLTGPLCDAVTGRNDGREMLAALERANLFIVPLDDRREWYRYHHLFADVLRARMLSERPDQVSLLHQRASQWLKRHDLIGEAIRHSLAAHDFDRAAYLIELAMPAIRRDRQNALMYGWLRALPDDTVRRSPVLSVFYGDMLLHSGNIDAVGPRLDDAERALAQVADGETPHWADTQELRTLPATIAIYRASVAQARGDTAGTTEQARRALDLAGPEDHLARAGAAGFLGLAMWAEGHIPSALETFAQAVASLRAAGNLADELTSTVVLADLWCANGRPSRARGIYDGALQRAEAHGAILAAATAQLHTGLAEIDVEAGNLPSAREHLQAALAAGEPAGMSEGRFRWFVTAALLARADGEPEKAVGLLGQAAELYRPGFFPDVRPISSLKARMWIAQGNLSDATEWARERGVAATDEASYLREFDHLTLVRLLLALHRAEPETGALLPAGDLLIRLHEAAQSSGRAKSLLEIRLLQALVHDAQGHRPQAREFFARAIGRAPEPESYLRLFLDEGAPMLVLLREASEYDVAGNADYQKAVSDRARRLLSLAAAATALAQDSSQGQGASPTEPLSDRELQVLRLLDSELTGPQIARELFVSHNTVRTHTKHIFTKLDVTNRRAAVLQARERGLL